MDKLSHLLSYFLLRIVCFMLMLLPLRFTYILARFIGFLGFHVLGFRRQVVLDNLQTAFGGELDKTQRKTFASQCYKQTAMTFLELMIAPKLQKQIQQMLEPEQKLLIQEQLQRGHGLITVSGHLGNWEFQGAAAATVMSEPFVVAAAEQSNPYVNRFITQQRSAMGMQVAGTKQAMKLLVKALKNRQAIGLVADQRGGGNAVFVDFFGKNTACMPGPAQLALKYKAPMLVGAAVRTGPGQFKVLSEQVEIKNDDTVETLTQRHVKILEGFIRQYPEQYFWLHRRWKEKRE